MLQWGCSFCLYLVVVVVVVVFVVVVVVVSSWSTSHRWPWRFLHFSLFHVMFLFCTHNTCASP